MGRAEFGLEARNVVNYEVPLNFNLNGLLPHDPFKSWISTELTILAPGTSQSIAVPVTDFDVSDAGFLRYKQLINGGKWYPSYEVTAGPWAETTAPYHPNSPYQIEANDWPYSTRASFRAGRFVVVGITASAALGDDQVTVTSATDLAAGDEFYFSTDADSEPLVDRRFITDITGSAVTFEPALGYALPSTAKFRRIDLAVRTAVAYIVADMITFPPSAFRFNKDLGSGAIVKQWERVTRRPVPPAAMERLGRYLR